MSVGFKIKKLREDKNLSQPELAAILNISQAKLSNIENEQTKKIDFLLMDKVCHYFDKDFDFFTKNTEQVNNVDKNDGSFVGYNHGTINLFPENIIDQIRKLVEENNFLKEENRKFKI
ncbi:helix-turn-helix transcriptional regulator [Flavobacterium sp.]|uniref:helix-turn-helix domain-containing protein n=1 Tax=Flavobacterium sp. TaxID=239 RepID=UPI00286E3687|nr:helix-turn-helix transcriptional regulator [Flavobacterium sp.]